MIHHRGVAIPEHLGRHVERVPVKVLKALTAVDLVARLLQADDYVTKADSAHPVRDRALRDGYRALADAVLSAPPDTAEVRAEHAELLAKAEGSTGDLRRGYEKRAAKLASGRRPESRFVVEAERLVAPRVGTTRFIDKLAKGN